MPLNALKAFWEVHAGVIPGEPIPALSKRWNYTSEDHEADDRDSAPTRIEFHARFSKLRAEAVDYYLQVSNPAFHNWAVITFVWL